MRLRAVPTVIVAFGLLFPPAFAEWQEFLPRPVDNGAFVEFFAASERDENNSRPRSVVWTDNFLREKITVFSNGYFYHPRFLQYRLSLGGALKQEQYDASFQQTSGWRSASGLEYDGRLLFLPEHPYNLELFARRYEPLFKEQSSTQHNIVETTRGAFFRYRQKPYFFHASYNGDSVESDVSTSRVERLGVGGEYFKRFAGGNQVSFAAAYNPLRFSNSFGLDGRTAERTLNSVIDFQRARLSVDVIDTSTDQDSRALGGYGNDQFSWYELVSLRLPLSFRAEFSYRITDNKTTFTDPGVSQGRGLNDNGRGFHFDLFHRLYQSLDSRYTFLRDVRNSSNGEVTTLAHSLVVGYAKAIPNGRILAGFNIGRNNTDNRGQADVVNEQHPSTHVPSLPFLLGQQNVQRQSVAVFVKTLPPTIQLVRLLEGFHYTLQAVANTFQITVLDLPAPFVVPGDYDLSISYSLIAGDFELQTKTFGYSGSVQLFDDRVTPYYSYAAIRSKELSGTFPGEPVDSTTFTTGVMAHRGPIRGRAEYQTVDWDVSPYHSWRGEIQAVKSFDASTRLYLTATYLTKRFPQGTSQQQGEPYTEESETASGNLQKQLGARGMTLAGGASYARFHGLTDSTGYSANGSLGWKIGKMDLSMGASVYTARTEGTLPFINRRTDQYYYVRLRRELF